MRVRSIILICFLISACAPVQVPPRQPTQVSPTQGPSATSIATLDARMDEVTSAAIADLSARLLLDPASVRVVSAESQLWPDASLGCPHAGESYTQQTVPGYKLRLEVDGLEYIYHTDTTNIIVLCVEDDLPSFPITPGEIDDGQPWMPVD